MTMARPIPEVARETASVVSVGLTCLTHYPAKHAPVDLRKLRDLPNRFHYHHGARAMRGQIQLSRGGRCRPSLPDRVTAMNWNPALRHPHSRAGASSDRIAAVPPRLQAGHERTLTAIPAGETDTGSGEAARDGGGRSPIRAGSR